MPRAKRKSAIASAKSEIEAVASASASHQHHHQQHQQDGAASSSTLDATASNLAGYYVPAVAPSDVSTSGDEDDEAWITNDGETADTTNTVQPEPQPQPHAQSDDDDDDEGPGGAASSGAKNKREATCRWNDCGQVFADMIKFIDHLHNTHVGSSRNKYACEWTGCSRRGKPQTSRFALLSHLRSHTGEKPFTCPRPDCDKSFTRSDALSKHMRVQHDIMPAPARGGRLSAAALAERAAAEKAGHDGGRSSGAGTRSSARRSALAAAVNNNDAASLDEELLGLAEGGAAAVSTAAQIAANADAMPGDPLHWTYEAMFPHEEGNDAQQQTQPQQQQATTQSFASGVGGGGSNIFQPQQTATGSSRFTDEELGIERFSSIRRRIQLSWVDGTLEDWNPTSGALAAAVDTSNKPELLYSHDDQAAEAEAVLVLERARRHWVQEMAMRQEAEFKEPGGSGGAFVGKGHTMLGGGKSSGINTPADGPTAGPSSATGGAFYDSDSDMSDAGAEDASSAAAPAPAPPATAPAPTPAAAPTPATVAPSAEGTPNSGRPKRQIRPPASRHLDDSSDAGGDADASSSKMQVDDNGGAATATGKTFDEESALSSPPSSPVATGMSVADLTRPAPAPAPQTAPAAPAASSSRRPAAAASARGGGGDSSSSSSNRTLLSTLIRAHLVESSKLSIAQAENRRLVADLEGCLVELRDLMWEKKRVLEAVLEMELGADVKAIFDPAPGEDGQQHEEEHQHHNGQEDETMGEVDGMPHHHDGMSAFGVGDGASAVAAAAAALQHHAQQQEQRAYG